MSMVEVQGGVGPERSAGGIVTPEAVVLDVETAGYASRILAGLFDLTIQLALLFIVGVLLGIAFFGDESGVITAFAIASFLVILVIRSGSRHGCVAAPRARWCSACER